MAIALTWRKEKDQVPASEEEQRLGSRWMGAQADSEKEATYEHLHGNPKGNSVSEKKSLIWHIG